jgi:hypothetical protein
VSEISGRYFFCPVGGAGGGGVGTYLSAGITCMTNPVTFWPGPNGPASWFFADFRVSR